MRDGVEVDEWKKREDLGSKQRETFMCIDLVGESLHQVRIA